MSNLDLQTKFENTFIVKITPFIFEKKKEIRIWQIDGHDWKNIASYNTMLAPIW